MANIPLMEKLLFGGVNLAARAAFMGAKATWKVGSAIATPAINTAFAFGTPAVKAAAIGATRTAAFGLRHPQFAMGVGAAGLGVYAVSQTGPQSSDMNTEEVNYLARMTGSSTGFSPGRGSMAYDTGRMAFHDSTTGLVHGLHRGRHG